MQINAKELNDFLKKCKFKEINEIVISANENKLTTLARANDIILYAVSDFDWYMEEEYGIDLKQLTSFLTGKDGEAEIVFSDRINIKIGKSSFGYLPINPLYVSTNFSLPVDMKDIIDLFEVFVDIDAQQRKDILALLKSISSDKVKISSKGIMAGDEYDHNIAYGLDITLPEEWYCYVNRVSFIECISKQNEFTMVFNYDKTIDGQRVDGVLFDYGDVKAILTYMGE